MLNDSKVSEMLIKVGGNLLQVVDNQQEMQAHLDLIVTAWNIAIHKPDRRRAKLKRFIKKQKKYAPNPEVLQGLEWEIRRIIMQKDLNYPEINSRVVKAEALEKGKNDYIIRAYFKM